LKLIALAILAAHGAILIAALVRRRIVLAMLALNLALAIVVVLYNVSEIVAYPQLWEDLVDGSSPVAAALVAFELTVATAAVAAFGRVRFTRAISAAAFGLHLLASAASVALVLTLKFDRLI
jgi:hypothetical protein